MNPVNASIQMPEHQTRITKQPQSTSGTELIDTFTIDEVSSWTSAEVGNFIRVNLNYPDAARCFEDNGIMGMVLEDLDDKTLKDVGIHNIGERMRIAKGIRRLIGDAYRRWQEQEIWSGSEHRACCCAWLPYGFPCCCTCCVGYPSDYKLSNSRITITVRDGCCMGVCAPLIIQDNADLFYVTDVDTVTFTPCCSNACCESRWACSHSTGAISLSTIDGVKTMFLAKAEALEVFPMLTRSVQAAQLRFISDRSLITSGIGS